MHFLLLTLAVGRSLLPYVSAEAYPPDEVDHLAAASMDKLHAYLDKHPPAGECTLETAIRRREWSDLAVEERQDYIQAVMCLQSTAPLSDPAEVPGARSRFDDFVAVHINQTLAIHGTANFLGWHRYYLWAYEKALREECGYQGYQPYWNWARYAADPIHSPLFDGSPSSMGGNGAYYNYSGVPVPNGPPGFSRIPPDQGGGCVTSGPFMNMSVNLGPMAGIIDNVPRNPRQDGFGYNPRCLRRDVNKYSSAVTFANYTYDLIMDNYDIYWFQTVMQGQFDQGKWGVHVGGHFTNGGDPGGDFYSSSGDPVFYLHHGMIDRVWWVWQLQDLETRQGVVSGTITMDNNPPSRNGTLDDPTDLGVIGGPIRLGDLLTTMGGGKNGEFCYIYE